MGTDGTDPGRELIFIREIREIRGGKVAPREFLPEERFPAYEIPRYFG